MFVVSKGTILVGNNFVEAVTGQSKSHGNITLRRGQAEPVVYVWNSTLPIAESEKALRQCAKAEGLHVAGLKSQAL